VLSQEIRGLLHATAGQLRELRNEIKPLEVDAGDPGRRAPDRDHGHTRDLAALRGVRA
jgi:hypothetical protein